MGLPIWNYDRINEDECRVTIRHVREIAHQAVKAMKEATQEEREAIRQERFSRMDPESRQTWIEHGVDPLPMHYVLTTARRILRRNELSRSEMVTLYREFNDLTAHAY